MVQSGVGLAVAAAVAAPPSRLFRFDARVVASTVGFIAICLANWIVCGVRWLSLASVAQEETRQARRQKAFSDHAWTFFALAYVFYPTLSFLQFQGLVCVGYDDGDSEVRLLKADLSIDCENDDDWRPRGSGPPSW